MTNPLRLLAGLALAATLAACGESSARSAADPAIQPVDGQQQSASIDLATLGHAEGAEDAPVTVYEFSDFGCRFCSLFTLHTYPELRREFVETGKVRWVSVPFVIGMFPNGESAARAAECAAEQDRYFPMHQKLFEAQSEWANDKKAERLFAGYARELGLDAARYTSCYAENRGGARTANNTRAAEMFGITGTPTFFVNGRMIQGALPLDLFREVLHSATGAL
jgi:protein-disulfide isomerase